jgi:hypothetical protein
MFNSPGIRLVCIMIRLQVDDVEAEARFVGALGPRSTECIARRILGVSQHRTVGRALFSRIG